jgi:hypothetical protein
MTLLMAAPDSFLLSLSTKLILNALEVARE